jgi:hypothetical protein
MCVCVCGACVCVPSLPTCVQPHHVVRLGSVCVQGLQQRHELAVALVVGTRGVGQQRQGVVVVVLGVHRLQEVGVGGVLVHGRGGSSDQSHVQRGALSGGALVVGHPGLGLRMNMSVVHYETKVKMN